MGVAGLWSLLEPAQSTTTLTALSLSQFGATSRGYRIGIDASIWFFHAEYGREGENPHLRTLFFRCAQLTNHGFLPLFVFDGPKRPDVKRGKRINKSANKLTTGMQSIIEAFGFEYRTAPAEAEAELAFLNRVGIIDGILSDDVDNFLFGARTVIRNHSSTHPTASDSLEKSKVLVYDLPHPAFPNLVPADLIFIALCSGGDYDATGLPSCGIKTAYGLAQAGFGRSLHDAALKYDKTSSQMRNFLQQWRVDIAQELRTNSSGFLPSKKPALAKNIPDTFPDIDVLLSYITPITSESLGRTDRYDDLLLTTHDAGGWTKKDPSLPKLAEKCEFYFEWGFMESIIKRFRTVIFHGVILRILRRAMLLRETGIDGDSHTIALDLIRKYFASSDLTLDDPCPELVNKIHSTRRHLSTSNTLEYRLDINPSILVHLTASGVKGIRRPDDVDEWADDDDEEETGTNSDSEVGTQKTGKVKKYPDPHIPLRLWVPAVLVKGALPGVVEAYEDVQRKKAEKKAGKGTKKKDQCSEETKSPSKTKVKAKVAKSTEETVEAVQPKSKVKAKTQSATAKTSKLLLALDGHADSDSSDNDGCAYNEDVFLRKPTGAKPTSLAAHNGKSSTDWISLDDESRFVSSFPAKSSSSKSASTSKAGFSSPAKARVSKSSAVDHQKLDLGIKSFFSVEKPIATQSKGKLKAVDSDYGSDVFPRSSRLLARLDSLTLPKERNTLDGYILPSSGERKTKMVPTPFPMSFSSSDTEYTFDEDEVPPPGPPAIPLPRKNVRKGIPSSSSSSEEHSSPEGARERRKHALNKTPRKVREHSSPRQTTTADNNTDHSPSKVKPVGRTIRDISHPSRVRAASPSPAERNKSLSTNSSTRMSPRPTREPRPPAPQPQSLSVVIIISSDSETDVPPSKLKPKAKLKPASKQLSASDGSEFRRPESSSCRTSSSNAAVHPLLLARARAKEKLKPVKTREIIEID